MGGHGPVSYPAIASAVAHTSTLSASQLQHRLTHVSLVLDIWNSKQVPNYNFASFVWGGSKSKQILEGYDQFGMLELDLGAKFFRRITKPYLMELHLLM